jgi:hypothetical protein
MLLTSKNHTAGDTTRFVLAYGQWMDNAATITSATFASSSATLTVDPAKVQMLGRDVVFFVAGGAIGETATVTVTMQDSFDNVKIDTLAFTVVAP